MTVKSPFQPRYGSTQTFASAAASAQVAIGVGNKTLRVKNVGSTNVAYVRTGRLADFNPTTNFVALSAANGADLPVYPGEVVYIEKPMDHDTLAHISPSGTNLAVTAGEGGLGSGS